jgi:hypothetical protein
LIEGLNEPDDIEKVDIEEETSRELIVSGTDTV